MRPLFLDSPLDGFTGRLLTIPLLVLLFFLAPFSKQAEVTLNELFGKEEDEGELEVRQGPIRVLTITDGTVGEDEEVAPTVLVTGLKHD